MTEDLALCPTNGEFQLASDAGDVGDLLKAFLAGRNPRTIQAYAADLANFARFAGVPTTDAAAKQLLGQGHGAANRLALGYRAHLVDQGRSPSTVNRRLAALRSLVQLARTFGMVPWSLEVPSLKVQTFRDTRGPGLGGVRALLDVASKQRNPRKAARDHLIIRLLFDLGLRASELTNLDLADYDAATATLAVLGKGQRQKTLLTLPSQTKAALEAWLEVRGRELGPLVGTLDRLHQGKRLLRTSLYRLIHNLGTAVGLNTRPHGLRHAAITAACERAQLQGMGLEEVLDFSRHAKGSVGILMVYRDRERNVQGKLASLVADAL